MERMRELIALLNEAARVYYQEDGEIMPDREYDALYDELYALELESGIVLAGSPTQKVGYEILGSLTKVSHGSPMLSLNKTKNIEEMVSFLGDKQGLLSWKIDGLTVALKYSDGEMRQAVTRGNGLVGEDITHNARFFKNIPMKISVRHEFIVRGEAVISFADFEKLNSGLSDNEKYKNPRNLTSGTVRQLNSKISASRNVNFLAFSLLGEFERFGDSKSAQMESLENLGFETVETYPVTTENLEEQIRIFKEKVGSFPYATDG